MRAKNILVLVLLVGSMFTEGCNLQEMLSRVSVNNQPLMPLGPTSTPGLTGDPLSGSLAGGLPLGPTAPQTGAVPGATVPGATNVDPNALAANPATNAPTSPSTTATPAGINPPAPVSTGNTGSAPQATPIGTGPILPGYTNAELVGMAGNVNPLSSIPQPATGVGL